MSGVIEAIGLISGVLGILSFIEGQVPPNEGDFAYFRIAVGLDDYENDNGDTLSNAGGNIDSIRLYNNVEELIGVGGLSDSIPQGEFKDAKVPQGNNQQPSTTIFQAGDDAVCIAYITATMGDGNQYGWTGDWASICGGMAGFPSGIEVQTKEGEENVPRCMWLDQDHSNGIEASVIGIHWSAFTKGEANGDEAERLCGEVEGFRAWPEEGGEDQMAHAKKKRSAASNYKRNVIDGIEYYGRKDERLVVSSFKTQNATEVCAEPTNYGPDFVSLHEGVYCDMDTRKTLPLCGTDSDALGDCFDLDASEGKGPARRSVHSNHVAGRAVSKKPTKIVEYGKRAEK